MPTSLSVGVGLGAIPYCDDGPTGDAEVIKSVSFDMSVADMCFLDTLPFPIPIPAPGVGKLIAPLGLKMLYTAGASYFGSTLSTWGVVYDASTINFVGMGNSVSGQDQNIQSTEFLSGSNWPMTSFADLGNSTLSFKGTDDMGVWGPITASSLSSPGSGYSPGETFTIDQGVDCVGVIDSVDGSGAVTAYHLTNTGQSYTTTPDANVLSDGAGTGLTLNLTVAAPATGKASFTLYYDVINVPT